MAKPTRQNALYTPVIGNRVTMDFFSPYSDEYSIGFIPLGKNGKRMYQWGYDSCIDCLNSIKRAMDAVRPLSTPMDFQKTFIPQFLQDITNNCVRPFLLHPGIDYGTGALAAPVRSVAWGEVEYVDNQGSGGFNYNTKIRHVVKCNGVERKFWARYCHLDSSLNKLVRAGDFVSPGQIIANGLTLAGTGPHLHFEIHAVGGSIGIDWKDANKFPLINLYSYLLEAFQLDALAYMSNSVTDPNKNIFASSSIAEKKLALKNRRFGGTTSSTYAEVLKVHIVPTKSSTNIIKNQIANASATSFLNKLINTNAVQLSPQLTSAFSQNFLNPESFLSGLKDELGLALNTQ